MKKKNWFALLLTAALSLSLLTGCGGSSKQSDAASGDNSADAPAASESRLDKVLAAGKITNVCEPYFAPYEFIDNTKSGQEQFRGAAGAVNTGYRPGDVMIISDHIKLAGHSPLRGPNVEEFGPRFFDVTRMYTPELRKIAVACAEGTGIWVHEGVYMFFTGPQFETPAEIRAARILGADAVGMSTVTEALTAAHCGMPLLALSVMTNMAAGVLDRPLTTEEVDETSKTIASRFSAYMKKIVAAI